MSSVCADDFNMLLPASVGLNKNATIIFNRITADTSGDESITLMSNISDLDSVITIFSDGTININ